MRLQQLATDPRDLLGMQALALWFEFGKSKDNHDQYGADLSWHARGN